jgi:hypothetical protein
MVSEPSESCQIHRWAALTIRTGEAMPPLAHPLKTSPECQGCAVCEAVIQLARAVELERAMLDRPLRVERPQDRLGGERRDPSPGSNVDPAP